MAAKKKRSAARTRTVYRTRAAPRRRRKSVPSGVKDIPAAAMTVGILAANKGPIWIALSEFSLNGLKSAAHWAIQPEQLKKTATYALGGAAIGYGVQQFAPKIVKKPLGKAAKKIKAVF